MTHIKLLITIINDMIYVKLLITIINNCVTASVKCM